MCWVCEGLVGLGGDGGGLILILVWTLTAVVMGLEDEKKAEPVFRTPMSFSPWRIGDLARPSPSRVELWKEELGLEDDGDSAGSGGISNSDDETEVDQNTNKLATCSLVEYETLQKEVEERSAQRDELLYHIKTLNDKNKIYKTHLEREELTKKQQLKILQRTHKAQLEEKAHLITNLEAIVDEQEMRVLTLEANSKGEKVDELEREHSPVSRLVAQIDELQTEKITLIHRVEQCMAEVERLRAATTFESDNYRERVDGLEHENTRLQEEVIKLRNLKSTGSTDAEKQACRLEMENDRLKRDIHNTRQTLARIQSQADGQSAADNKIIKKLKEDNVVLTQRISEVETELVECEESERRLKQQLRELDSDSQTNARQVRDLSVQLTALQAKSPEVVTKVQHVEIESRHTQELLDITRKENEKLKDDIESLREQLAASTANLQREQAKLRAEKDELQQHNTNVQQEKSKLQQDTMRLRQEKDDIQRELSSTKQLASSISASSQEATAKYAAEIDGLREKLHESTSALQAESAERESLAERARGEKAGLEETVGTLEARFKEAQSHLELAERKTEEVLGLLNRQEEEATIVQEQLHVQMARFQAEIKALHVSKAAAVEKVRRESAERQCHLERKLSMIKDRLSVIEPAMAALVMDYRKLRETCRALPAVIKREVDVTTKKLLKALKDLAQYNEELVRKYRKEMALRKKYHNELVELKGNIRVFARLRPRIKEDGGGPQAEVVVDVDAEDDGIVSVMYKGRQQTFEVDKAFLPDVAQSTVFDEVQALVTSCIDGYNVCIFAYGQTGSGKTFTMEGTLKDPGINQRALQQLFVETAERSGEWQYIMSVSVIEIYNEMIRDLLVNEPNQKLETKMAPEGGVHVPGLSSYEVNSVHDVNQVFAVGRKNRQTASTNMNEHSSRSHALLCVTVMGTNLTTGVRAMGKLNLVDLAGSERVSKSGADGDRLKEAQSINKSLSCLGDVIHAMRSRQSHVPYRNSKLTYLLQDSLGGDSKTLMIVQVSPVEKNVNETNASLSFAQRVRSVELGMATRKLDNAEGTPSGSPANGLVNSRGLMQIPHQGSGSKLSMARRK